MSVSKPAAFAENSAPADHSSTRLATRRSYLTGVFVICLLLMTLGETGCVTTDAVLPDPATQTSAIEYTKALRRDTSTLLDAAIVRLPSPSTKFPDYKTWEDTWCPRHEEVYSATDVHNKLAQYCQHIGGTYVGAFCRDDHDPDRVAFYARLTADSNCQRAASPVRASIIEPNPGKEMSAGYLAALRRVGYQTQNEIRANALAAQTRKQEIQEAIQAKRVRDRPLLRTVGTRICRRDDGWLYTAFVEGVTKTKIQIRIVNVSLPNNSNVHPGGWGGDHVIWDRPDNWSVCE